MLSVNIQKKMPNFTIDVDFQVENEIAILFGPSGSGKTTILNCISGLTRPDTGTISLFETILFKGKKHALPIQKRNVGYLFQDYALFPHMTVIKNIEYGSKDNSLVKQLITVLDIPHLLNKYPRQISGGEKQRVALARALATKPQILLLDEPFSALDQEIREECQSELLRLHSIWNIPVIMVTHDLQEAKKIGSQILRMSNGIITERITNQNEQNSLLTF
ncbi:ATP-binding cassette domain-containing protein [Bacillus sp. HMF5848]|uniref:ATP-binding cassette domain-containing protein n=1 Tax=Bacillus sp. HMF5848 TaxID=2495421 RepID=UPI000F773F75|nr:ATP-binding cassette domain-containing protein [Bacillus sp. HMF5848]RSK26247.1 ATP-binding cassette domain-containing protein [Bacillus sp. HMF5848]